MNSQQHVRKSVAILQKSALLTLLVSTVLSSARRVEATPNLALWDTSTPTADALDPEQRTGWKSVPHDLLALEADPPKASSDPGYYGREYSFKGDAVVENRNLTAVFRSAEGRVVIYSKDSATLPGGTAQGSAPQGRKIVEFVPLQTKTLLTTISRVEILRNGDDEVALEVSFSAPGLENVSALFTFDKTEIVEIKPAANMKGIRLLGSLDYGVVPSFIGDDLIFGPGAYPADNSFHIPSENLFLGLLPGENKELVLTWPKGKQQMTLQLGENPGGKRSIESVDFDNDGQSLYLAVLSVPGIWHKESLSPSYLEKDVTIQWKRPFPAKWKTQLYEAGVKTTFAFKEAKADIWRGVPGSYSYPVWFSGDDAFYHLSKKVPPKDESLVYFVEGQDTPPGIPTPVDIMRATLGRQASDPILDIAGQKLRTHHRRGGDGVRRACTCGCTEAIQAVFTTGEEVAKKDYIAGAVDDMIYFVHRHVERIDEYRHFADDMLKFLEAKAASDPGEKTFLEDLEQIVRQIPQEYDVQKENMKSFAYADDLARQTLALAGKKDLNNQKAYADLLEAWRGMGGAQDYVLAQCHAITRKLCQQAGYECVNRPESAVFAEEIRTRCRQCLRNPDGYEIWADY